jgi:hypothetical protein
MDRPEHYRVVVIDVAAAVLVVAVVAAVLLLSMRLTGQVAESFGADPKPWQARMLPFALVGPVIAWVLLSRRGGGRGGWA